MASGGDAAPIGAAARLDIAHVHLRDHRHAHEMREIARLQFLHDPRAVHLDSARTDAQVTGDGLVRASASKPFKDLALPRRQPVEPPGGCRDAASRG